MTKSILKGKEKFSLFPCPDRQVELMKWVEGGRDLLVKPLQHLLGYQGSVFTIAVNFEEFDSVVEAIARDVALCILGGFRV
jgi:hypothetical protein